MSTSLLLTIFTAIIISAGKSKPSPQAPCYIIWYILNQCCMQNRLDIEKLGKSLGTSTRLKFTELSS